MKIERTKSAGRNLVFGTLLKGYQIVVPFLMRTVMIRFMGPGYLGLDGLFVSILHVLNLAELGVGSAMVYGMYQAIANDDDERIDALMLLYRRYYRLIGIAVLVVGLALVPALPMLIAKDVPEGISVTTLYLMNLAATVLSYWLFAYRSSLIQAHQREDVISKVTIVSNTIQYVLQLGAIVLLHNYYLYVWMLLLGQVLTNVLTAIFSLRLYPDRKPRGVLAKEEVANINQRIRDLFTSKVGAVVLDSCDPIIITAFLGLEMLAIYQNYYYVITALAALFMVFFKAIAAGVGNSLATESLDKNYADFLEISCITLCALGVCVTCMLGLYQPFVSIAFGSRYLLPFFYVLLYCVFFYVYEVCRLLNVFKDAAGIWHSDRLRPLLVSILNLVLNFMLVRRIGLMGVLLSTILSYYFLNLPWLLTNVFTYVFKRGMGPYLREVAILAAATVASCLAAALVCSRLGSGIVGICLRLVACMAISIVTMSAVAWRFSHLERAVGRLTRMVPALKRLAPLARRVQRLAMQPPEAAWVLLVVLCCMFDLKSGLLEQYLSLRVPMVVLLLVAGAIYLVRYGLRPSSPMFACLMLFAATTGVSSLVMRSAGISGIASALTPMLTLCLVIEAGGEERLWLTLRTITITLGVMVVLDLASVIAFPEGMYPTALYDTYYYLGYKTQRTWVQLPLLGIAAASSIHDHGKLRWWVWVIYLASLGSTLLTHSLMACLALLAWGLGCAFLLLDERLSTSSKTALARAVSFLADMRLWACCVVGVAVMLSITPIRDVLAIPISALTGKSVTLSGRTIIWSAMWGLIFSSPIIGLGHVSSAYLIKVSGVWGAANPHSLYLSVLLSGGVVGMALVTYAHILAFKGYRGKGIACKVVLLSVVADLFLGITSCNTFAMLTLPLLLVAWRCGQAEERG